VIPIKRQSCHREAGAHPEACRAQQHQAEGATKAGSSGMPDRGFFQGRCIFRRHSSRRLQFARPACRFKPMKARTIAGARAGRGGSIGMQIDKTPR